MLQTANQTSPRPPLVPLETRLGPVHIAVTDGERALPVWRDLLGLTLISREAGEIHLGAGGRALIVLHPGAVRPVAERTSGLYHVAIHVPQRSDLARVLARLIQQRYPNSPTDHLVTETTYLWDPDGNGIEVAFETPQRGRFVSDGEVFAAVTPDGKTHSGRDPLDVRSVLGELRPGEALDPLPAGTRVGHVHVHVADLDQAMAFYRDVIGFEEQFLARRFQMGDLTLGTYPPHIIAFNTWAGRGAAQAPPGSSGLRHFTIELPDEASLAAVRGRIAVAGRPVTDEAGGFFTSDPAGNRIRLALAA